jgi:hypothetical protein
MTDGFSAEQIEKDIEYYWANYQIQPRWAAIGIQGRDALIAKHGFKEEDFQRFGNLYFLGTPDANAIMDAESEQGELL